MRRLGVLGGTFDPIHDGHIALAREAIRLGGLDGVVLLPMARPSHRETEASPEDRLAMCRLALKNEENLFLSQSGMSPGVQFTTDTLAPLQKEFPGAELIMIIGADKLPSLSYWREKDKLFAQCAFLCFARPGVTVGEALERAREAGARITMLGDFAVPYSASLVRARTAQFEDAPGLKREVLCYMARRGLYQPNWLPRLQTMMNPHRFQHTLGVRDEAVRLAALHDLPVQRAALAGLLHDCAKGMSTRQMAQIARENHLIEDENMLSSGAMMHGPVGAYVAKTQFGIRDEDVLNAIRSHTIGRPGMTNLELCIFVADATEAGREEYEGLGQIRALAERSLAAAALCSMQLTQDYLARTNRPFFPIVLETMAYLESIMTPEEKQFFAQTITA